jgi:hypothetical protein
MCAFLSPIRFKTTAIFCRHFPNNESADDFGEILRHEANQALAGVPGHPESQIERGSLRNDRSKPLVNDCSLISALCFTS